VVAGNSEVVGGAATCSVVVAGGAVGDTVADVSAGGSSAVDEPHPATTSAAHPATAMENNRLLT